jgi:Na+/proline symporter
VFLDYAIILGYLVLMLGIGVYYRRFAGKNLENYFLAGRSIPGWLNGISYTAALVSADSACGYGGLATVTGAFVCWWYLSRFVLALFVGAVLFAVLWRRLGLFTSLEFYELRFGGKPAALMRLWIAFRTSCIAMPAWTGVTLLAACKIMEPVAGMSKTTTLLWVLPVSFLYVFMSGYKGVVVSNLIQMITLLVGSSAVAVLTLIHFGGPWALGAELTTTLGPAGVDMTRVTPPLEHEVFPLAAAIAWLFGQTIGYGGDAAPMGGAVEGQRILSTRSPRESVTMYVVTAVSMSTFVLLLSLPCVAAPLIWPELQAEGFDRELAYGMLMKKLLPTGLLGLALAGMLAGVMSTVSDNLNFGSPVMVSDLYQRWIRRDASEQHYLLAGKACLLIILAMCLLVVYRVQLLFKVGVFMLQLSAAELPANWAQWWWWRFNGKARLAASFRGAAIFCVVVLGTESLIASGVITESQALPWWWQTFLVMGLTTALWVSVALMTEPESDEILDRFYARVVPLGSWEPVRRRLEAMVRHVHLQVSDIESNREPRSKADWSMIGRGLIVAGEGAVALMLVIVGISAGFVGKLPVAIACFVMASCLAVAFRVSLTPFLDALDRRPAYLADNPALTLNFRDNEGAMH